MYRVPSGAGAVAAGWRERGCGDVAFVRSRDCECRAESLPQCRLPPFLSHIIQSILVRCGVWCVRTKINHRTHGTAHKTDDG